MINNIFLSPHSDDQVLFGAYIIQRVKPLIIVCTDGTSHQRKFGIPIGQRREESKEAAKLLGVKVEFLGIPEEELTIERLRLTLKRIPYLPQLVFAPAKTGGNPHHDIVSEFGNLFYSTYSKNSLVPTGEMAIVPTVEELSQKNQALTCFTSQVKINPHHFEAVKGFPAYLSFNQ